MAPSVPADPQPWSGPQPAEAGGLDAAGGDSPREGAVPPILAWGALLLAATLVRLSSWQEVFGAERVRFLFDTDPHYHVLRAIRTLHDFPRVPWTDPFMNYPAGAPILWPPLFDFLIAAPVALLGGGEAALVRWATVLPVVLGVLTVPIVWALGRALVGRRAAFLAAVLVAILPVSQRYSLLGHADQHVLEVVANGWIFLAFLRAWRGGGDCGRRRWLDVALMGAGIVVAFWNWQGSALYLVTLSLFVAVRHVAAGADGTGQRACAALGAGAAAGAAGLVLTLALFAPHALRETNLMGVTLFHATLVALSAAFGALLGAAARRRPFGEGPAARSAEVVVAALLPGLIALAVVPGLREGFLRGVAALLAGNTWYADVAEFHPLIFSGRTPLGTELGRIAASYGLSLLCLPAFVPAFLRARRRRSAAAPELEFLAFWVALFLSLTLMRNRFSLYLIVPLALALGLAIEELTGWLRERGLAVSAAAAQAVRATAVLVLFVPSINGLLPGFNLEPWYVAMTVPMLQFLRDVAPASPDRPAVLSSWSLGHAIQYFAGKPVVVTPFGTDGGVGAMEDSAAFFLAADPAAAEAVLQRRRVGFVLAFNLVGEVQTLHGISPQGIPEPAALVESIGLGATYQLSEAFLALPVVRLYFNDGSGGRKDGVPGLGAYRLLYETPSTQPASWIDEKQAKLFAVVPGATLAVVGARPESRVVAVVPVLTNTGRRFAWGTFAISDAAGRVEVRVPYATGTNGRVEADRYAVGDGERSVEVAVSEEAVTTGGTVAVDLAAGAAP